MRKIIRTVNRVYHPPEFLPAPRLLFENPAVCAFFGNKAVEAKAEA